MQSELNTRGDLRATSDAASDRVRRRRVFYIPGYDPFHPRRYRELYRKESKIQAGVSGYDIALQAAVAGSVRYGWHVEAQMAGEKTETDFEVLVWSDIVKETMTQNIPRTYLMLAQTAWTYIGSGAFSRLLKTRKGPMIAALYPIFMLTLQLIIALVLGSIAANLMDRGSRELVDWITGTSVIFTPYFGLRFLASLMVFLVVTWQVLRWFRKIDNKLFAYYLMHDYSWSARNHGESPPELEARINAFRTRLHEVMREPGLDEVLIVGHSSGAHVGVSLLADLLREGKLPEHGPTLSFLTLGQVVPMVSFLKNAWRLRADLKFMSAQDQIPWVDVTAPGDGCAFALCDPVSVSGVASENPDEKQWPLVFSAAFTQSLTPARWKELRWRFFRLHFQYLCAFDAPKDYDYFQITAGPMTLWQRYGGRNSSKSRLETPLSPYVSTKP